jgi:predicted transcriptional regulator
MTTRKAVPKIASASVRPGREQARQSFRDEASRAWRDYKETGFYATEEEVYAWIESLSTR